jgi:hypothetical protein
LDKLKIIELKELSKERLDDAQALYDAGRNGGAMYICGYAVEMGLKYKICEILGWDEYPTDGNYKSFKTHNLEVLLHLSGVEKKIKKDFLDRWSIVLKWNAEYRYSTQIPSKEDVHLMLESIQIVLDVLYG